MKDICKHMKDGVCRKRLTAGMTICPDEYDPTLDGRCRLKTAVYAEWAERVIKGINTPDLIAELEKRRPCRKCAPGYTESGCGAPERCFGCMWLEFGNNNFKEAK